MHSPISARMASIVSFVSARIGATSSKTVSVWGCFNGCLSGVEIGDGAGPTDGFDSVFRFFNEGKAARRDPFFFFGSDWGLGIATGCFSAGGALSTGN